MKRYFLADKKIIEVQIVMTVLKHCLSIWNFLIYMSSLAFFVFFSLREIQYTGILYLNKMACNDLIQLQLGFLNGDYMQRKIILYSGVGYRHTQELTIDASIKSPYHKFYQRNEYSPIHNLCIDTNKASSKLINTDARNMSRLTSIR